MLLKYEFGTIAVNMNLLWPYHCFLLRQVRSAKGRNSCQMARCASLWPRRGSSLLNFAHAFRILSDSLGVLVRILLWVEAFETYSKALYL